MKKFFTLAMLALITSVTASAQTTLRKTWDFRDGFSKKTINALKADMEEFGTSGHWRNWEKSESAADERHFWSASSTFFESETGYPATFSGDKVTVIPELKGLSVKGGGMGEKHFVIVYDESQTEFESSPNGVFPYGKSHLWINGGKKTLTFQAEVNQTIKIGVESHKNTEARGIELSTSTGSLELLEGEPKPKTFNEAVWNLTGNAGDVATITIKTTSGCHIYYIIVGEGDDPSGNSTTISYLTAGDATTEAAYQALAANANYNVTPVDAATVTVDALKANTVTVVSPELPADHAAVAVLKDAMPYTPILNLNAGLYAAWGYGETETADPIAVINNMKSDLFADFVENEDYILADDLPAIVFDAASITGVKYGEYFAEDDTLACDAEKSKVFIHAHNIFHNAYVYMPKEAAAKSKLLFNAIEALRASKSVIDKAAAPKIKMEYKDKKTNITMAMASNNMPKAHIYYTLDGSEPTEASTEYKEMITVTEETTVKAVAIAEGYLLSDVATAKAEIFSQPETPTASIAQVNGFSIVTLDCASAGVDIYYNYSESNDSTKSTKYTAPITLMTDQTLTAFAVINNVLSEPLTQKITVSEPFKFTEVLSHMDANKDEYYQKPIDDGKVTVSDSKVAYYFSWGKTKTSYAYYDETAEPIGTTTDPETGDVTNIYPKNPEEKIDFENGWAARSRGQIVCNEITISAGKEVAGDGSRDGKGVSSAYNPATVDEFELQEQYPVTNYYVNIGEWNTEKYPRSGMIYSTQKFKGPFAILSYISNGKGADGPLVVFETGKDIEGDAVETEWAQVGDTCILDQGQRLYKKFVRVYNGNDEVYVRTRIAEGGSKAGFYDIYILAIDPASITGISEIADHKTAEQKTVYNLNGIRQNGLQRGLNIVMMSDGTAKKVVIK